MTWADGHVARYCARWLRAWDYSEHALADAAERAAPLPLRRPSDAVPREICVQSYTDVMTSETGVWEWMKALNRWALTM